MVQLSPAKRLSAADYLARWQDSLFPQSFESFLRPFMRSLQVGWHCINNGLLGLPYHCCSVRCFSSFKADRGSVSNGAEMHTGC